MHYVCKLVALIKCKSDLSALALILIFGEECSLNDTLLGYHRQVFLVGEFIDANECGDLLAGKHFNNIYDIRALCCTRGLGNLICLTHMNLTEACEEH